MWRAYSMSRPMAAQSGGQQASGGVVRRATSTRFQPVGCVTLALVRELSHKPCFDGGRSPFCRHGHALSP
jgi:hypothetical protein